MEPLSQRDREMIHLGMMATVNHVTGNAPEFVRMSVGPQMIQHSWDLVPTLVGEEHFPQIVASLKDFDQATEARSNGVQ